MNTLYNVQLARALGAMLVVYAHIGYPGIMFGHFGVDIFFIISGFIMTMICCKSSRHFFPRRLVRIVPLYWAITAFVYLLSIVKPSLLNSTGPNVIHFLKSIFFVPYVKEDGLTQPMLDVGWTLNYEMYFYAAIALSLLVVPARLATLVASTALVIVAVLLHIYMVASRLSPAAAPVATFYSTFYIFEFVMGVLVYYLTRGPLLQRIALPMNIVAAAACLVFMAYNEIAQPFGKQFPLLTQGLPSMIFVAALLLLEHQKFIFTKVTILGDASYAIYLTNQFVVEGMRKIVSKAIHLPFFSPPSCAIVLVAAAGLGVLIYLFLEKPVHDQLRVLVDGRPADR